MVMVGTYQQATHLHVVGYMGIFMLLLLLLLLATNASAVANGLQLSGKHWLIESWYKSAVPNSQLCLVHGRYEQRRYL